MLDPQEIAARLRAAGVPVLFVIPAPAGAVTVFFRPLRSRTATEARAAARDLPGVADADFAESSRSVLHLKPAPFPPPAAPATGT